MRTGIENHLTRHWYSQRRPPWYLRMLEPIYRVAYRRVQTAQQSSAKTFQPSIPLIVVGNITAGGTGKTPLVVALSKLAVTLGLKPGIASTGYGRNSRDTFEVTVESDARNCGDEPVLLARHCAGPVVVAADRSEAVRRLQQMNVDLIISDDGLQQSGLRRDLDICVVDGERGVGNGYLLPAGPLREPAERLETVDYVITNGEWPARPEGLDTHTMLLSPTTVRSLDGSEQHTPSDFTNLFTGIEVHAYAAIGNPGRFFHSLESLGVKFVRRQFPDHHQYRRLDFAQLPEDAVIVMTEKDAVKCHKLGLKNAWYLSVEAILTDDFTASISDRIKRLSKEISQCR